MCLTHSFSNSSFVLKPVAEYFLHASLCASGIADSTLLISSGPTPVAVRLCLGLLKPGPTGPCNCEMGAPTEGLRSLVGLSTRAEEMATAAMLCGDVDEESKQDM